ncbi:hypothetical protein AB0J21_15980 [Streptomyces sp. NPDC049954]|uniref:hypothetical protein n=1 Tax=Streptomyces sp. NPDC049954 TaxID=3155779 RepID=UPI00342360C2
MTGDVNTGRDEPRYLIDDSAYAPHTGIWFAQPAGFRPLPFAALLAPEGSVEAVRLRAGIAPLVERLPQDARRRFEGELAQSREYVKALTEVGTVHCSLGLHQDDEGDDGTAGSGSTLLSLFTVAWRETAWAPGRVTAARAVTGGGHEAIELSELACGPVSFSETVRHAPPGLGLPREQSLLQFHAHLPHPDRTRLALLTLATTAVRHRAHYRAMLRDIAAHVSFENPLPNPERDRNEDGDRGGFAGR